MIIKIFNIYSSNKYAQINIIDPEASATAEVLYEVAEKLIPSNNFSTTTLSLNEHYKILLPKKKYHNYKKINAENMFKLEDSVDYKKQKEIGAGKYIYHNCMLTKAKYENLYAREFVEYYLNLGVDKFYFGDDDPEEIENLFDVLDDYVKKGIVDIDYIFHLNITHHDWYEYTFSAIKSRCKWILLFDVDEFLEFTDKNMTIKTYLDMPIFDKCDVIKIYWKIYDDNNLLYYDNRPVNERFTHVRQHNKYEIFMKSIMRGKDYGVNLFSKEKTAHTPSVLVTEQCDAEGNFERLSRGMMGTPKFKLCYLKHFTCKTAEEYAIKLIRGIHQSRKYNLDDKIKYFKVTNDLTEEKLKIIEKIIGRNFPNYHNK